MTLLGVYLMQIDVSNRIANSSSGCGVLGSQEVNLRVLLTLWAKQVDCSQHFVLCLTAVFFNSTPLTLMLAVDLFRSIKSRLCCLLAIVLAPPIWRHESVRLLWTDSKCVMGRWTLQMYWLLMTLLLIACFCMTDYMTEYTYFFTVFTCWNMKHKKH